MDKSMTPLLSTNWWSLVIRGVLAVIVGLIAFALPGVTIGALVILFGAYAFVDGVLSITGAVSASKAHERWGALLLEGIAGIVIAGVTVFWPAITALALVWLIGAWSLVTGLLEIATAIQLRRYIRGEWILALSGVVSVVFGIVVLAIPLAGAVAIAFCIGAYSLFFGVLMIALGFRLRGQTASRVAGSSVPLPSR
jgi:uncharacterized membrane protein HdeD (DUF308 family)